MNITRGRCLLKRRLKEAGMRQVDLAIKTGYSVQAISNYALNRSYMSPEVMYTISKAVYCKMEDLYEWKQS